MAPPPGPPPPGPPPLPNWPNEDTGPAILGATLGITSLALITLFTRLYVRVSIIRNVGWDDYVMIFAMCLCIAGQGLIIPEVQYGAGRHLNHIKPEHISLGLKLNFITQPLYLWGICFVKQSIGFFLLRIASTPFYRRTIISIMVFMLLYTFACFMTIVLQCEDLNMMWDFTIFPRKCWGIPTLQGLSYTNVALNIVTDILFAVVIPIPMLWHVQMNRRQKTSIVAILSLGVFATAAAAVKIGYLPNYGKTGDLLWDSRNITIWTVVECNVGIIAGNLPCLKPLFRRVLGSTYGRSTRPSAGKYYNRPYGGGTGRSGKAYSSLSSNKEREGDNTSYGADEEHMMKQMDHKPEQESTETVYEMGVKNKKALGKFGGIKKTTEVDVIESPERNPAHIV